MRHPTPGSRNPARPIGSLPFVLSGASAGERQSKDGLREYSSTKSSAPPFDTVLAALGPAQGDRERAAWLGRGAISVLAAVVTACGGDDGPEPAFPADWAASYVEVRNCRTSADHDLGRIRVLADPLAAQPYRARTPFPPGAVVLKAEYDFADTTCTGPIVRWSVMTKLASGEAPAQLDWAWQRVTKDRRVESEDDARCFGCHTDCGVAPDGFDGTCAVP